MIKPWMVIGGVTLLIALFANILRPKDIRWFRRLERPQWLTFEKLIPVIWSIIFVCGAFSAHSIWQIQPDAPSTPWILAAYVVLEVLIVVYSPIMLWSHNLLIGTAIGAAGCIWGLGLMLWVLQISGGAAALLLPYLLWGPIGTYTTWRMAQLNDQQRLI